MRIGSRSSLCTLAPLEQLRHVDICTRAFDNNELSCLWSLITKPCHSKIGHFGSHIINQQHVAGEISVDNMPLVWRNERARAAHCDITTYVDLNVVGDQR